MSVGTNNRREFMTLATAAVGALAAPSLAAAGSSTKGDARMADTNRATQLFKPEFHFGLGGVPLRERVQQGYRQGGRGHVRSRVERGRALFRRRPHGTAWAFPSAASDTSCTTRSATTTCCRPRSRKLMKASKNNKHADLFPLSDSPNDVVYDYSADGVAPLDRGQPAAHGRR